MEIFETCFLRCVGYFDKIIFNINTGVSRLSTIFPNPCNGYIHSVHKWSRIYCPSQWHKPELDGEASQAGPWSVPQGLDMSRGARIHPAGPGSFPAWSWSDLQSPDSSCGALVRPAGPWFTGPMFVLRNVALCIGPLVAFTYFRM